MHSAPLVAKDAPCIGGGELPIDAALAAVCAGVPGARPAAQLAEGGDPVAAEALPRPEADLDLGWVEPARVLGGVVHRESPPEPESFQRPEGVGERFLAVGVQVVHHEVDGLGGGVGGSDLLHRVGEARSLAVAGGVRQVAPALGLDDAEDVRRPVAHVLVIAAGDAARDHGDSRPGRVEELDRSLVQRHDGLPLIQWFRQDLEDVFHPCHVLLVQLRNAPHFFPATASARGGSASCESSPGPLWRRSVFGSPPRRPASSSSATDRAAAARRPSPRWLPAAWRPAASPAWASRPRPALPQARPSGSAIRPAAPLAGRCRRQSPRPPWSSLDRAAEGCGPAARPAPRLADGPALSTPPGPRPKAPDLGTDCPSPFVSSPTAVDQISRPSASSLIDSAGAEH